MKIYQPHLVVLFLLCIVSIGCKVQSGPEDSLNIKINAIGDDSKIGVKTCLILPYDSSYRGDYLLYKEIEKYVENTLNILEYKVVGTYDSATSIIFIDFGAYVDSKVYYEYTESVYSSIGNSTQNINTTLNLVSYPFMKSWINTEATGYSTSFSQSNTQKTMTSENLYQHYFIISCFDARKMVGDFNRSILWKLKADLIVKSDDVRKYVPYLISGSKEYFGRDTHQKIDKSVSLSAQNHLIVFKGTSLDNDRKGNRLESQNVTVSERKVIVAEQNYSGNAQKVSQKSEITSGDVVYFLSDYGERIFGLIKEVNEKGTVTVLTYPTPNNELEVTVNYLKLFKLK